MLFPLDATAVPREKLADELKDSLELMGALNQFYGTKGGGAFDKTFATVRAHALEIASRINGGADG